MNQRLFRLVVLGDPHIGERDLDLWQEAIEDIRGLKPAGVLVLGDLTGSPDMGSSAQLAQAVGVLNQLGVPWRSIIGNHDLQWEGHATDAQAVGDFLHHVGRDTPWFRWDWPMLTILGLSNTVHRDGVVAQEIVLVDEQLDWLDAQLTELADRPVLLAIHAPPVGSGVVQLAELHAHVGNALVNQNHRSGRVMKCLWQHPNVLMSFSGHNHLGQHLRDALSIRLGIHFVHTGVAGRHARDGHRHSRVLDVHHDHFELLTFDHLTRQIDPTLTYRSDHSLMDWMTYRRNHHLHRLIPADPATMRQGPEGPISLGEVRFAVLSDAHLTAPAQPMQRRVVQWANQQALAHGATHLLLNGDLSHQADVGQVQAFLKELSAGPVCHVIPGNNEGMPLPTGIEWHTHRLACDARVAPLAGWPGLAFSLGVTSADDLPGAVAALAALLPGEAAGTLLIVSHIAPKDLADPMLDPLRRQGLDVVWIAGHEHATLTRSLGRIRVEIVAGLDPVKTRDTLPEVMLGVWDGTNLRLERRVISRPPLTASRSAAHRVGLAYLGEPADLLADAMAQGVPAVQFRGAPAQPDARLADALAAFRQRFPQGQLSIHLPAPGLGEDGPDLAKLAGPVAWATAHRLDDWTIHLPAVPAVKLYADPTGRLQDTPWARACVASYVALARQAIDAGAQLSLENVNNNHVVGPQEELLSCRPWHVTRFIDHLREALVAQGRSAEQAARVGMIFDSGHAFTDPVISKRHGLGDWVTRAADYIQMAHIHQAVTVEGRTRRHTRIDGPATGRINHVGLIGLLQEYLPRPVTLLVEVRDRQDALASARTIQGLLDAQASAE